VFILRKVWGWLQMWLHLVFIFTIYNECVSHWKLAVVAPLTELCWCTVKTVYVIFQNLVFLLWNLRDIWVHEHILFSDLKYLFWLNINIQGQCLLHMQPRLFLLMLRALQGNLSKFGLLLIVSIYWIILGIVELRVVLAWVCVGCTWQF